MKRVVDDHGYRSVFRMSNLPRDRERGTLFILASKLKLHLGHQGNKEGDESSQVHDGELEGGGENILQAATHVNLSP